MLSTWTRPKNPRNRRTTTLLIAQKMPPSNTQKMRFAAMLLISPRTNAMLHLTVSCLLLSTSQLSHSLCLRCLQTRQIHALTSGVASRLDQSCELGTLFSAAPRCGELIRCQIDPFWPSRLTNVAVRQTAPNGGYASARVVVLITGSCPCRPAGWARPAPVICTARSRWTLAGGRLGRRDQPPCPRIAVLGCLEGVELGVLGRRVPSARRACLVG